MSDDNTQGAAEPSLASAGSHGPVAWTVGYGGGGGYFTDDERKAASWRDAGATVTPLYRQPQPTLTEWERSVIQACVELAEKAGIAKAAETLRGVLERAK